jgi:hypothetical protein
MVNVPPNRPGLKRFSDESQHGPNDDWDGFVDYLYGESRRANSLARNVVEALQSLLAPDVMLSSIDAAAVDRAIRAYRIAAKARDEFAQSFTTLRATQETMQRPTAGK